MSRPRGRRRLAAGLAAAGPLAAGLLAACSPSPSATAPTPAVASGRASPRAQIAPEASAEPGPPPAVASGAAAPDAPASPPGACPDGTVEAAHVCVDRFEAPNVQGEKPLVMVSADEAERWCAGRGKRLCSEDEWTGACGGPSGQRFPYGTSYHEGVCFDDARWVPPSWGRLARWPAPEAQAELRRLDQREPSGTRPGCVSPAGVRDTTGSVAEWARRTRPHEPAPTHVVMGCYWGKCFRAPHTPTCDYAHFNHPDGWRSYEIGFRCCAERRSR